LKLSVKASRLQQQKREVGGPKTLIHCFQSMK
jgi:hypothetical protein